MRKLYKLRDDIRIEVSNTQTYKDLHYVLTAYAQYIEQHRLKRGEKGRDKF